MDTSNLGESAKRWIGKCRLLARRISSAMPVTAIAREETLLPFLFFAVGLLGGLRIADSEMWRPPPLFTVMLALLIVGALNRCGAFVPVRLLSSPRSMLENLKGLLIILAVVFASAQVFDLTTPDGGPARMAVYALYLMVLIALNTRAIAADRARLLRSLIVIFGLAFTVKFVVLPSSPAGGWREIVCEIVTLGMCQPRHPATGYLAFFTLFLYLFSVARLAPMARDVSERPLPKPTAD